MEVIDFGFQTSRNRGFWSVKNFPARAHKHQAKKEKCRVLIFDPVRI